MTQGVAVLACGRSWEIYDLGIHARPFDEKRAAVLTLNQVSPDAATDAAHALHYWISREWWALTPYCRSIGLVRVDLHLIFAIAGDISKL